MLRWHKTILLLLIFLTSGEAKSWGFFGHRRINRMAIYALPPEMFGFFKANMDYLEQHAVDPDKRRYADKAEGARHYIDLDHYLKVDREQPLYDQITRHLPLYWKEAVEKFTEDSLKAYGIVPWHLQLMVYRLTEAFKTGEADHILKLAAEIGHYAADAHVPLHTTENYNGQLTGQKGIHALWESRIPERKADHYRFDLKKAVYLDHLAESIWHVVADSHREVAFVLQSEKELHGSFDPDKIYRNASKGRTSKRDYTAAYVDAYASQVGAMVEQRMVASSQFVASLWYTAWVNAGQPILPDFISEVDSIQSNVEEHDHD